MPPVTRLRFPKRKEHNSEINTGCMKNVLHWLAAAAIAVSLPATARAAPGDDMVDHPGMGPYFYGGPGPGHLLDPRGLGHDFAFRDDNDGRFWGRGFDGNNRFFHRHRFFGDLRFFGFGYPHDWYREYYGYPYDYSYYNYGPVYGDRYSSDLAVVVQAELARRGYYHGPISGVIGPGTRRAIEEFQTVEGLPVTGRINESLLRALRTGEPSPPPEDSSVTLPSPTPSVPKHDSPPVALWVKGKEGQQVLSPFTGGIVDVSGFPPGSEARCPYSGKIFLVPMRP
jgi:Putative peptidoglycan binding domain